MASNKKQFSMVRALGLAILGVCLSGTVASAATATSSFTVTASVASSCTVGATNIAFGAYVPTAASVGNSTITATCTSAVTPSVTLGFGNAGSSLPRYMASATTSTSHLPYYLFQDSMLSVPWGLTSNQTVTMSSSTGIGTITVYGQIPANEFVPAATDYTDTINVTLTY
ncbi:spore coat protein U domain-containing protein [Acidisoma cellulosilytica]|uniref:Spore coat protein U domain-containing protein n=1 Tax=Acidisoma cellulosilyticum TaxID=2802395 RepID=A0A963Z309_9PROT|nr:spore coat U domain-containing protein [Acidisoma cellulosilyticum]MCB8881559.1 spore coat protein U domain-containing protein [Acidisoma cellulosilyticum]